MILDRLSTVYKAVRNEMSGVVLALLSEDLGQERETRDNLTLRDLRDMALKSDTVAACVDSIVTFCSKSEIQLISRDPSKEVPNSRAVRRLRRLLDKPNSNNESFRNILKKLYRDLAILDQAALEIVRDEDGEIAELWVVDPTTIKVVVDRKGRLQGYDGVGIDGQKIKNPNNPDGPTWQPDEIIFFMTRPKSETPYGYSKIETCYAVALIEMHVLNYIGKKFTEGRIPFGVLDLGKVSRAQLKEAIDALKQETKLQTGFSNNRILVTGSGDGGMKFHAFGANLKDLTAPELMEELRRRVLYVFGVTENELGQAGNVNKANGFNLSFTFKTRAVEPVLDAVVDGLNQALVREGFGIEDAELVATSVDARDDRVQAEINESEVERAIATVNEIRRKQGKPPLDGGDIPFLYTPVGAVPLSRVEEYFDAQIQALKRKGGGNSGGQNQEDSSQS